MNLTKECDTISEEIEYMKGKIQELEDRISKLEKGKDESKIEKKTNSMRDFVEKINPSNHEERSLAIAYYIEHFNGRENFTMKDIEDGYRDCKQKPYSNMSMLKNRLKNEKEWIMQYDEDEGVKTWVLTADGEDYIEEVLEDE